MQRGVNKDARRGCAVHSEIAVLSAKRASRLAQFIEALAASSISFEDRLGRLGFYFSGGEFERLLLNERIFGCQLWLGRRIFDGRGRIAGEPLLEILGIFADED